MKQQRIQHWILAADLIWTVLAMALAYSLRYGMNWYQPAETSFLVFLPALVMALILWSVMFARMKLDGFRQGWFLPAILAHLFLGVSFLILALLATEYMVRQFLSRFVLLYFGFFMFLGLIAIRCTVHAIVASRRNVGELRRVVILGNGPVSREMAAKIESHPEMLCQVVGFLSSADSGVDNRGMNVTAEPKAVQTLGVPELLCQHAVDELIITVSKPGVPEILRLIQQCRGAGIDVSIVPHPYELYLSKPQLLDIGGLPVLKLHQDNLRLAFSPWKRVLDLVFGFTLLVLSLPVVAIAALMLMGRKGGPFCRELRCGQSGKLFRMWRLNSDRDQQDLPLREVVLQQFSITELPQLWNVVRGEMSLVGPRPESPERVKYYSDWQRQRLNVKPGMTGLAQVRGLREKHSSEEKSRFDLQYMLQISLFYDLSLLLQTIWTLFGRLFRFSPTSVIPSPNTSTIGGISFQGRLQDAHSSQPSAD